MEKPYWKLVKELGSGGLNKILKDHINFRNPKPKPEDLVGMLNNNDNYFYIWIKGVESNNDDKNLKWKWEATNSSTDKFAGILIEHRDNIVPLGINLPKHNSPVIWYLIRKPK